MHFSYFIVLFFAAALGGLILYGFFMVASGFFAALRNEALSLVSDVLPHPRRKRVRALLEEKFPYFRTLDVKEKIRFHRRLEKFMLSKLFYGRNGLKVTWEMKALISASAIQLSFGLDTFMFSHFTRIYIYPESFFSTAGRRWHKGEVTSRGTIALSWKDFVEGYAIGNDNFNLGLHEMAHALKLEHVLRNEYELFFAKYIHKWHHVAMDEFIRLSSKKGTSILRSYGGANIEEFFAVCIEHFFENPAQFRSSLPDIYLHLCILLNQDPAGGYTGGVRARLTYDALRSKTGGQKPLFRLRPKFSMGERAGVFSISGLLAASFFIAVTGMGVLQGAGVAVLAIGLPMAAGAIRMQRELVVYPAYITWCNPLFRGMTLRAVFIETLVLASFTENGATDSQYGGVVFTFMDGAQIRRADISFKWSDEDVQKLIALLKERKVPVEEGGA